ncbi:MAG: glycosyltransferase family 4 protein [Pseudomonadota bacterium]|nr:glycosyltransferase family 4 protein [Pseudomonadota bacterium]
MFKVAAFTGGIVVPSARFRVRQYIPTLQGYGVALEEMWSRFGCYPPKAKWKRPIWASATLAVQLPNVVKSWHYDAVLLQREMLSTFVTLESLTGKPRILDVDDAIFLNRGDCFARRLAQLADRVICGNAYLAERFSVWNRDVTVIATTVDAQRYIPIAKGTERGDSIVIGWIGTSANLKYLYDLEAAIAQVMKSVPGARLRIVCDKCPAFQIISSDRVDFIRWSEEIEVASIQGMDIGIMPLEDTEWARGKCSFKMLQYMSCGLPVVVSPVGMNLEVLALGTVGIGAATMDQWIDALLVLLKNAKLRTCMGVVGRQVVETYFSIEVLAPRLAVVLKGE